MAQTTRARGWHGEAWRRHVLSGHLSLEDGLGSWLLSSHKCLGAWQYPRYLCYLSGMRNRRRKVEESGQSLALAFVIILQGVG